jgi:hypothetical protein
LSLQLAPTSRHLIDKYAIRAWREGERDADANLTIYKELMQQSHELRQAAADVWNTNR